MIIVTYKNEILGDGLFWKGPETEAHKIHNIPARMLAERVLLDGKTRQDGMWTVTQVAPVSSFSGIWSFLSNFYPQPFVIGGVMTPTSEHMYQAMKAQNIKDFDFILIAQSPGEAKRRGKMIKVRSDWPDVKIKIMRELLERKFENKELRAKLIETYPHELVEHNTWGDRFWGKMDGIGENHLGKILMDIRSKVIA